MQVTTPQYDSLAKAFMRPVTWGVKASFDKSFDATVKFFQLDVSMLDSNDILAPDNTNPVQAWDKYAYKSFDDRAISIEVVKEMTQPYSITQAYADVTLNNYDNYFTPNSGSPIDTYILPRRPFRAAQGFGNLALQQIVGLTTAMPEIDKHAGTASFHIIDFMSYLMTRDISQTVILQNVKTDQVLSYLLQVMGITPSHYVLDGSVNTIKFFYVDAGTTFGSVVAKLMEAEIGSFYMDEQGMIRFKNRYNYSLTPLWTFDKSNTLDYNISDQSLLINSVNITGSVRAVQPSKSVGTGVTTAIKAGATVSLFINFNDPVTSVTSPTYSATAISNSYFTSALNDDGTGAYTNVALTALTLFSKSVKLTFQNTGGSDAYLTTINIYGTPAEIVQTINVSKIDQPSIDKYEEQIYSIDNEYIQDVGNATTRATMLLRDYKDYANMIDIDVVGNPALQIGDAVNVDLDGFQGVHVITKSTNITTAGQFKQRLSALKKLPVAYFTLNTSVLNGTDLLAP